MVKHQMTNVKKISSDVDSANAVGTKPKKAPGGATAKKKVKDHE